MRCTMWGENTAGTCKSGYSFPRQPGGFATELSLEDRRNAAIATTKIISRIKLSIACFCCGVHSIYYNSCM